jgi:hypothetical protein
MSNINGRRTSVQRRTAWGIQGGEDGLRVTTPEMAVRPFKGWLPGGHRRAWRDLAIFQGVHGHPLPYAHAKVVQTKEG